MPRKLVAALLGVAAIAIAMAVFVLPRLPATPRAPAARVASPSPQATEVVASTASPTSVSTSTASPTPPPPTPVADACTSTDLDMVVGAATAAAGGEEGVTALLANLSGTACQLAGSIGVQLLSGGGTPLPTSVQAVGAAGRAWLVPDRVALDPWEPQPGEATVQLSWHTGDTAPGVCSAASEPVSGLTLSAEGATVTATVDTLPGFPRGMVVCRGALQVGAISQVTSAATFPGNAEQAGDHEVQQEEGATISSSCTPASGEACLTRERSTLGTMAAYFEYLLHGSIADAACNAYVYRDGAGWHPLDVVCTQSTAPASGGTVTITNPGGGCVRVHSAPGHASRPVGCLSSSSQVTYSIEGAPAYVPETDSKTGLPMGTIWWYLAGANGWVAQDFIAAGQG